MAQPRERLRLIRADRLEQVTQGNRTFKRLTGDVLFEKGELRLACDLAYWFEDWQRADFYGHVVATKDTKRLTADTLTYYSNEDVLIARGHPQLEDDSLLLRARRLSYLVKSDEAQAREEVWLYDGQRTVTADRLTYLAPQKKSIALGRALIEDQHQRTSLTADSLVYFNSSGLIEATLSPVLTRYDSSGRAEFKIRGRRILLDEKGGNFLAEQQVTIWREDFTATGEKLTYTDSLESALLEGHPKVVNEQQELTGALMEMHFHQEQLTALFIYEEAKAIARGTAYLPADSAGQVPTDTIPTLDEITGRNMAIYFAGGRTDSLRVYPMAASRYHALEDSIIIGINEVSGDTVIMNFANNKLSRIRVVGSTEGRFIPHPTNRDLDTTVVYSSEFIDYDVLNKKTYLIQAASMRMGDTQLTAGRISIEWNNNLLYADPLITSEEDSSGANVPTLYQRGREPFAGENMVYNLKTQRGRIIQGKTKEQDGYYYGQHISKVGQKVFYVKDGLYTTCDLLPQPHFYFRSRRMKIIFRDKVIARPIVLYIHEIPILALPFGVFPNKGGRRHSGWIMPTWIENKNIGGSLQGFGYFWAPNDYWDLRLTGDFYDKKGLCIHSRMRYALRYCFEGSISGSYFDQFLMNIPTRKWTLNINHSQTLSPTTQLSIDGRFVSDEELYRKFRYDREDRLNQYLISNATLRQSWPGKPYSLSINLNQEINLQAQVARKTPPTGLNQSFSYITRSLPNIAFSRSSKPLIPQKSTSGKASHWYNNIFFSINSKVNNRQNIFYQSYRLDDTTFAWDEVNQTRSAITHNITLNGAQKIFKVISLNPALSIDEGWVFAYEQPVLDDSGRFVIDARRNIVTHRVAGFRARHTGNASLNAQTKLYGLFPVRIGPLQGFRHVITPVIGFSYRPDFTKPVWGWQPGYVQTGYDSLGNFRVFDPFKNTLLGATPAGEYRALTFNLNNLFQMKTIRAGNPQKVDLFSLNISGSYNYAADSLRWSLISTTFRTQVTKKVAINLNATHDLYKLTNGIRINQWHKTYYGIPIPRLTNVSASTGFALAGKRFSAAAPASGTESGPADTTENALINPSYSNTVNERTTVTPGAVGDDLWSAHCNLRYNLAFNSAGKSQASFWMSTSLKVNLTTKWRLTYSANFDLIKKKLVSQDFRIERNLHCWQFVFTWTPSGYGQQYTLLINILSSTLQDIKYEERGGMRRGIGW